LLIILTNAGHDASTPDFTKKGRLLKIHGASQLKCGKHNGLLISYY